MDWDADALTISFAKMKTNQRGEQPVDPRHIFANPLMPVICPILSLGVYFLVTGFTDGQVALFGGLDPYERYQKAFQSAKESPQMKTALANDGLTPCQIGSHSLRKGAATLATTGTTSPPSIDAVCIRAGWKQPSVRGRYVKYDPAGDRYLGRLLAGLQVNSALFNCSAAAVLPRR